MPGESPSSASLLSCLTMRVLVEVVLERSKKGLRQKSLEDTSVKECLPTPVQSLIDAYLHALEPLHSHFYGIYIYGSIALGGFEELESDIDIVALTHGEWTIMELAQLEALHTQLIRTHQLGSVWKSFIFLCMILGSAIERSNLILECDGASSFLSDMVISTMSHGGPSRTKASVSSDQNVLNSLLR